MNIGIVGLGLIGGSFAKSIKSHTSHTVFGTDIDSETMTLARLCGAIDAKLTNDTLGECDFVFVSLCPHAAAEWTRQNARHIKNGAILIDMCGVKRSIVPVLSEIAAENGFLYIGGHPMAGSERSGFVNSSDSLFDGASMILTPEKTVDIKTLEGVKALFSDIGFSSLTFTTPDEHDRIIAYTSFLAHITSSAYVKSPEALLQRGFSAGSFRDMTRVAKLDENMWTELFEDNNDYLTCQLEIFISNLNEYLDALKNHDTDKMRRLLKEGKEKKAEAGGY